MTERQLRCCANFRGHLRTIQKRKVSTNCDGFDVELRHLLELDRRVRSNVDEFYTASKGSSEAKNRFPEVKPNEGTMVRLHHCPQYGDGTYINANYIDARKVMGVPFVYIAAQAPLRNTVLDFWRMIHENHIHFIVMLCAAQEAGMEKSATYWPALHEEYDFGPFSVCNESENYQNESVYRTLTLRCPTEPKRSILQMQHTAWPDQGVPQASAPLMKFIQTIGASPRSLEAPILVHCSGGVGRTGVFIALHVALAQFQLEHEEISIFRIVRFLKLCRSGMVHRKDQYVFLYYATQREMDRMILSAETGTNVLDLLPPEHRGPATAETTHTWTRIRANVTFPERHRAARRDETVSPGRDPPRHRRHAAEPRPRRDVNQDMAMMRTYLRRRHLLDDKAISGQRKSSLKRLAAVEYESEASNGLFTLEYLVQRLLPSLLSSSALPAACPFFVFLFLGSVFPFPFSSRTMTYKLARSTTETRHTEYLDGRRSLSATDETAHTRCFLMQQRDGAVAQIAGYGARTAPFLSTCTGGTTGFSFVAPAVKYASERPVRLAGAPRMEHPWAAAPVLSFAVEDRGEYAVCHQRGAVRLYDVREWVQPGCRGPPADLLSLSAHRIRDRRPGLGGPVSFGFSTVLFPDTTLHLLCGYHRAPMVDMFDLECVDEDTSDAARSFSLQGRGMGGGSPHPSCLAALAAPSAIAGLSDGGTLLLDPRVAAPVPGTGFHCRGGNTAVVLGQRVPLERRPSTAAVMSLAVVAQGGAPLLLSGSRDGTLALWDLRQLAHPVAAELHTGAITGIAHAGGAPHAAPVAVYGSRAVVGTSCGRIMEYAIGPTSLMQLGEYDAADAGLSDATSSIPSTRVALNAAGSLALLPHATHNAVMLLRRCSSPFSSATAAQREPFRAPGDRLEPPPGSQPRRFGSGAPVLPPGDPLFEGLHTLKLNEMAAPPCAGVRRWLAGSLAPRLGGDSDNACGPPLDSPSSFQTFYVLLLLHTHTHSLSLSLFIHCIINTVVVAVTLNTFGLHGYCSSRTIVFQLFFVVLLCQRCS
eukprot:gene6762-4853_t